MLIRALLVLLVVLNLGVAAWWLTRPNASPVVSVPQPQGVARLQLLGEAGPISRPPPIAIAPVTAAVAAAAAAEAGAAPETAAPETAVPVPSAAGVDAAAEPLRQCFSLGPFADQAASLVAAGKLGNQALHTRSREVPGKAASGYNVLLPPAADREAAQALAQRIGAAGFDDFLVISQGEQANGIALGRYGSRDAALRRQAALQAKGFPAQVQPVGAESAAQWWLDIAAAQGAGAAQLKSLAAAAQSRSLDCATLR